MRPSYVRTFTAGTPGISGFSRGTSPEASGNLALRAEAAKIGADAVIFPEVTVELHTYIIFPKSEMKAKGTAIKFR